MTTTGSLLDAALGYVARGWYVFPCRPRAKAPATCRGFRDATDDPGVVKSWWNGTAYNIGVATGLSGLVVIDIDDEASWDEFATDRQPLTLESATPSGGRHLWFAAPSDLAMRSSVSKLTAGVDVRADGGYVVAPPSVTPVGAYEWRNRSDPAPLPDWLRAALTPPEPPPPPKFQLSRARGDGYGEAALRGEADNVRRAAEGTRNATLNCAAFKLGTLVGARELDLGQVVTELFHAALFAGLGEWETQRTITSGLQAGIASPREQR